ncbi:hypothetical protein BDY19DRAFT_988293 [Irpex rosettiformis]|uniref:Uncharacterized protein n=1 Tax=Irpex rosettiformis TaxID=378272 RepID=A0ACB8UJJ8_9APHY|nr:hypothetical protein BDY19DRAFT_988293 [Irpex rosettiformis]
MSNREPLWYCHECHAEMRPLMVPDPHCASCNGTFVEKMENPADDPREFSGGDFEDPFSGDGGDNFLFGLMRAMAPPQPNRTASAPGTGNGSGFTLHIDRTGTPGGGARTTFSTRPMQSRSRTTQSDRTGEIPTLSDYVARNPAGTRPEGNTINGSLMFQYLLAMLQQPGRRGQFDNTLGGLVPPGAENGRMGDYVFNQEALDQIITQIMESSSAHPVAATEEVMEKLPREVLEEGSPLLEKDCAVCKDQFSLTTEDPDELVIVTLPCKHPFHEPCIVPWLKSSGTCPVCRYQLVPQPDHHSPGPGSPNGPGGSGNNRPRAGSGGGSGSTGGFAAAPGGIFGNLFQMFGAGGSDTNGNSNHSGSSSNTTGNNRPSTSRTNSTNHNNSSQNAREHVPGGWSDDMEVD